jgi:hypothetical protein
MVYLGYYDASGTQGGGECLSVVGIVASESQWRAFEKKWEDILASENVSALHMTEFMGCADEFRLWRGDERRREAFIRRLMNTLDGHQIFASAVMLKAFNNANRYYELAEAYGAHEEDAGAYSFLADNAKGQAVKWMSENRATDSLGNVFEAGDVGQEAFRRSTAARHVGSSAAITFMPKYEEATGMRVRQFEAADMLAWPYRRMFVANERGYIKPREAILDAMVRKLEGMVTKSGFFPEGNLLAMCASTELIPERKRNP